MSTDAHDILKTATNLFDVHNPKWEVMPRGPADNDAAESIERWLEWHMEQANMHGDQEAFRIALKHSTKYNVIAAQLDYLPYWCERGSEEYKDALIAPFCIVVHNPANVHYDMGSYGLLKVAVVTNVPATDVIEKWDAYRKDSKNGKQIDAALKKIEGFLEEDDEARLMYADYTDKKKRQVACYLANSETVDDEFSPPEGKDLITLLDAENELPFINWAISRGTSDPLLYSLHKGGLFENQCFLDTILDSVGIRRAFMPLFKHKSVSGKAMEVDFTGNEATVELNASDGEEAEVFNIPQLDPGIRELMDRNSSRAASATGLKNLANMNMAGNVQFATVNAMIQVSKSVLDPYIRNFEKWAVEIAKLAFQWVDYMGDKVTGYRTKAKAEGKPKGEKINIGKGDFDAKTMIVRCELLSNTPTDELQKVNMYNQMVQANWPVPKSEFVERMGLGSPEVLKDKWFDEKLEEIALNVFGQTQTAQAQLAIEQIKMQMQAQMQQQQMEQQLQAQAQMQGQDPNAQGVPPQQGQEQPMTQAMQGMNPAEGGAPPAMMAPQATRTMMEQA
ncbi:MAG: hypothetical protein EHM40_21325 [Chloroflexi bacterium]|nr:MAG: hypothetical protein EHM40_21325 [Chloroflexota bacterium]